MSLTELPMYRVRRTCMPKHHSFGPSTPLSARTTEHAPAHPHSQAETRSSLPYNQAQPAKELSVRVCMLAGVCLLYRIYARQRRARCSRATACARRFSYGFITLKGLTSGDPDKWHTQVRCTHSPGPSLNATPLLRVTLVLAATDRPRTRCGSNACKYMCTVCIYEVGANLMSCDTNPCVHFLAPSHDFVVIVVIVYANVRHSATALR